MGLWQTSHTVSAWFGRRKFLRYFKPHSLFKCMPTSAHLHPKRVASAPLLPPLPPLPLLFFSTKSHNRMGSKHTLHDATTLPLFSSSSPSRSSSSSPRSSSHHHSSSSSSSSTSSSSERAFPPPPQPRRRPRFVSIGRWPTSARRPYRSLCLPTGKNLFCVRVYFLLFIFHSKIRNLIVRQNGRTIKFCTQNIIKNGTALLSSVRCSLGVAKKSPPHHHSSRNTRMMDASSWSSSVSRCLPRDSRQRQHPRGRRRRRQKRRRFGPTRSGILPNENENKLRAAAERRRGEDEKKDVGGNRDDRGGGKEEEDAVKTLVSKMSGFYEIGGVDVYPSDECVPKDSIRC